MARCVAFIFCQRHTPCANVWTWWRTLVPNCCGVGVAMPLWALGPVTAALEYACSHALFRDTAVCEHGRATVLTSTSTLTPPESQGQRYRTATLCRAPPAVPVTRFCAFAIDDVSLVEVRFFGGGRRLHRANYRLSRPVTVCCLIRAVRSVWLCLK